MFITLQQPLFDSRYLNPNPSRFEKPSWNDTNIQGRIRYFGEILEKEDEFLGPWDGEKKYCNAKNVFGFRGSGPENFYKKLYLPIFASRIFFRRFQSDGYCQGRFEIGFNDSFEHTESFLQLNAADRMHHILDHLKQYLECIIQIKIGTSYSAENPLIEALKELPKAYYWGTTNTARSFNHNQIGDSIIAQEPILLVQFDRFEISIDPELVLQIKDPELQKQGLSLFYHRLLLQRGKTKRFIKTFLIGTLNEKDEIPVSKSGFKKYNKTILNLRTNILRSHIELITFQKTWAYLQEVRNEKLIAEVSIQNRVKNYFHKVILNLIKIKENAQHKQEIIGLNLNGIQDQNVFNPLHDLHSSVEHAIQWFKTLTPTEQHKNMASVLEIEYNKLKTTKSYRKPIIYFSYAWADKDDEDFNRETYVKQLYDSLQKEGYDVRMDKDHLEYSEFISRFMQDIGKGDLILIGLSLKYLKSEFCMWELYEIYRNNKLEADSFKSRILLAHVEEMNLGSLEYLNEFNTYWEAKSKEVVQENAKHPDNLEAIQDIYEKRMDIFNNSKKLISTLRNIKAVDLKSWSDEKFHEIKNIMDEKLNTIIE